MATIEAKRPIIHRDDNNNVYYNVKVFNEGGQGRDALPAVYNVSRVSPILERPSDYELAVVRFSIPATNIPIMVWSNWENELSVSMTYGGTTITKVLQFIPNTISGSGLYGNSIWNYQEFIDIINLQLKNAFDDMKTAQPLAPPTEAPYMTYNAESELCSLYAQQLYDTGSPTDTVPPPATIQVYFNTKLYQFFPSIKSFEQEEQEPLAHQMLIYNTFTNTPALPVNYYQMVQEYSTLTLWNDFTTIIFETDHIPVEPEYQPTINDTTRRLITDFEPLSDINNRQAFQYFGSGWKRWYDLKSEYPLRDIDLRVYWEDKGGEVFPVYLNEDDVLTLKILFRKKIPLQIADQEEI